MLRNVVRLTKNANFVRSTLKRIFLEVGEGGALIGANVKLHFRFMFSSLMIPCCLIIITAQI